MTYSYFPFSVFSSDPPDLAGYMQHGGQKQACTQTLVLPTWVNNVGEAGDYHCDTILRGNSE